MLAWGFGLWMWRLILACGVLFLLSADHSVVKCGALTSSQYDILLCSEPLDSDTRHVSGLLVPVIGRPVLVEYVRDGYGQPKFECGYWEMLLFYGIWCLTELICVQSSLQPWPIWPDCWLFTDINGCRAGQGCACLFTVFGWFEYPSSGVVGFYDNEPSWCCSLWFRNGAWLWSVGCQPDQCTWWNTWPPDGRCSWPSMGCCCSTHIKLKSLLSVCTHFDGSGCSELVC